MPVAEPVELSVAPPNSTASTPASTEGAAGPESDAVALAIDATASSIPIDRRLFGSNVPAWLGPDVLGADWFHDALADAGVSTIRMPGGSWSNTYPWDACELGRPECWAVDSARPSDFAELLETTGLDGMWTVSINTTAQSAAALVAFFNGETTDLRAIGVDRAGVDWGTVAEWASVRAAGGHAEPVRIDRWEVGNEVWGGRPDAGGDQCAAIGWEEVWTCDGTEYMEGDGSHDGYLAFREAMRAVDPTIEVGAVGVPSPADWSDWGTEVLAHADSIDFYVVHEYGFAGSPQPADAVTRARDRWQQIAGSAAPGLGPEKLAITEYNLVSFEAGDTARSMTTAANAFFLADTLGRFAAAGIGAANHWNMANGTTASGTDYGLVALETRARLPAFAAFEAWALAGRELLVDPAPDSVDGITVYATRDPDGRLAVLVLNAGDARQIEWEITGLEPAGDASFVAFTAPSLDAREMTRQPAVDLDGAAGTLSLPAHSISVIVVGADHG